MDDYCSRYSTGTEEATLYRHFVGPLELRSQVGLHLPRHELHGQPQGPVPLGVLGVGWAQPCGATELPGDLEPRHGHGGRVLVPGAGLDRRALQGHPQLGLVLWPAST